ncbi:DDE superfamily endonuclease [Popillia japonica]|uniref:DDE superfamily endonuclease n=1 Tax=Popillia japonica TaxID=7064 RepID=A0AAW1L3K7_POPJA
MDSEKNFIKSFKKFLIRAAPSVQEPALLLLDGHATHTKSIELINLTRENNVVLLCFPPHCTHRMQPLDISFMAPLNTFYADEARKSLRDHLGRCVTINQIGKLFGTELFMKAASVQTAVSGFRKIGPYPLIPTIFDDWMFAPAETTERPVAHQNTSVTIGSPTSSDSSIPNVTMI